MERPAAVQATAMLVSDDNGPIWNTFALSKDPNRGSLWSIPSQFLTTGVGLFDPVAPGPNFCPPLNESQSVPQDQRHKAYLFFVLLVALVGKKAASKEGRPSGEPTTDLSSIA